MDTRYSTGPNDVKRYTTEELRKEFLIEDLFVSGKITMTYSHVDRMVVMGIVPTKELALNVSKEFGVNYFLERREMGIINISKNVGIVKTADAQYKVNPYEALYLGKETKDIVFSSEDSSNPAKLYALSCPAHAKFPSKLITQDMAIKRHVGSKETCNERNINQYIHEDVLETCQLVMGMTKLETGCVWNTLPSHTHERRMEVYLYFDIPQDNVVFHLMGEPTQTRHIVMQNEQAVISPSWSIHSGCGTSNYTFVWGMCGENKTYDDMDHILNTDLR